ncbi:MAG: M1 family peptidase [Bacteroidetes bacterium]|nr:MAG: M1 family peptidase [Bacteroidota bacterium]
MAIGQDNLNHSKFKQLNDLYATPNSYRTASGAPGPAYWQQRADYKIDIILDDENQKISGTEIVSYYNNSPDVLTYLWVQLDQNIREKGSLTSQTSTMKFPESDPRISSYYLKQFFNDFDGGYKLEYVKDSKNQDLKFTVNYTMMRIDLPQPLKPGATFLFKIKWWYNINDRAKNHGRSGMEYFKEESNYIYTIAQFYPRMAVYSDFEGWQNKQFLGNGEFALTFGNYDVNITVPEDHVVAGTGVLQNPKQVMSSSQRSRFNDAKTSSKPVMIVTEDEAIENEKTKASGTKTWHFKANNVRDFAFASSRKFIWDAIGVKFGNRTVMAMSFYPKEGNPLWEQYSTKVVAHTIKTYSKYTFDFPYPVAQSIHTNNIGMEYPMICFNGGRPEADGTYSERTKYGMLGVIIHEVGHNFFPMIVNSDERQWTWMDEGLNTFLQGITEREWDHNYPHSKGIPANIVRYMSGDKKFLTPVMTNSESLFNFSSNAYSKPCTALNILRETVMGRELFDFAFKQYAQRWMFKHPTPEDLFRTMEDASAVDLDWFWRGWFYTTDNVDISLEKIRVFQADSHDPEVEKSLEKEKAEKAPEPVSITKNKATLKTAIELDESLEDFYNTYNKYEITEKDKETYEQYLKSSSDQDKQLLTMKGNFYELSFKNIGGLIMPIILEFTFEDDSSSEVRIPVEIWRRNNEEVTKTFYFEKIVKSIALDPHLETADVNTSNNYWPTKQEVSRFQLYKYNRRSGSRPNPMQTKEKDKE